MKKKGLILPSRDRNNIRTFNDDDLLKLKIIKNFKFIGTSLSEIKVYMDMFNKSNEICNRKEFLLSEKRKINQKINRLQDIERFIDEIVIKFNSGKKVYRDN